MSRTNQISLRTMLLAGAAALGVGGWLVIANLPDARADQTLDVEAGVQTIRLSGASTALAVTTTDIAGQPLAVSSEDEMGCDVHAQLERSGDTLEVTLTRSGWAVAWWCDPEVSVVLPESLNLQVAFEALAADLSGRFRNVGIDSADSVIHFKGSADHFRLTGDAAAISLEFATAMAQDAVQLDVEKLISRVAFPGS